MDSLETFSKRYLLDTYARNYTHFVRGDGAKLYTNDGIDFIDFTAGIGVNALGHNNPNLVESISSQASKMLHISNLFYIDSAVRLAQKMIDLNAQDMRVFFCNSGLEANECAIKIARIYGERFTIKSPFVAKGADSADLREKRGDSNGVDSSDFEADSAVDSSDLAQKYKNHRYKIITLENSFHGRSIATLKACGQSKMHTHFSPFPSGFIYAKDIDEAIKLASSDNAVVAIFLELIQGEGGIYAMPRDSVLALEAFCKENDILLMIDEVQSGVFRSGEFLASNYYGIKPNVITLAKGLAGGVPIGAVMCDKIDVFSPSQHGSTFGGNPLAMSAGMCVLQTLESYKKSGALDATIELFNEQLEDMKGKFGDMILDISGIGLMRGLKLKSDEILNKIIAKAHEKRVLVLKSGGATLRFLPPLTITKDEVDEGFRRLESAISEI